MYVLNKILNRIYSMFKKIQQSNSAKFDSGHYLIYLFILGIFPLMTKEVRQL